MTSLVLAVSMPFSGVSASAAADEHISEIGKRGLAAIPRETGVGETDQEALTAALDELYEITQDEQISPACRFYAETILSNLIILDVWGRYPNSLSIRSLHDYIIPSLPIFKDRCALSI